MTTQRLHILALVFLLTSISFNVIGQTASDNKFRNDSNCVSEFDTTLNRIYYILVDKMPTYQGGQNAMLEIIEKKLKWPGGECDIQGTVYVTFIIEPDGKVTNKRIYKTFLSNNNFCSPNDEALEVIDYLTNWDAGQCNGKNVAVQYVLPIKFSLN